MPTSENSDTGSRVTRSLRKRLTSMDSDASSRPGTPAISNLQSIPESGTPSKRVTRRVSVSTPAATPSKIKSRLDPEVVNSPARRSNRRRSLSIQDQGESTPQSKLKEPTVDVVKEEPNEKSIEETRRVTRSCSKSPLEMIKATSKTDSTRSGGRKLTKKSSEQEHDGEDLDNSDEVPPQTQTRTRKNSKVLIRKEKVIDEMVVEHESPTKDSNSTTSERKSLSPLKKKSESKDAHNDSVQSIQSTQSVEPQNLDDSNAKQNDRKTTPVKGKTPTKNGKSNDDSVFQSPSNTQKDHPKKDSMTESEMNPSPEKKESSLKRKSSGSQGTPKLDESETTKSPQIQSSVIIINSDKSISAENSMGEIDSTNKSQTIQSTVAKRTRPEKLKNVLFEEHSDDDAAKNSYPKTPGLTKSKSYITDSSKDGEKEDEWARSRDYQDVSFTANKKKTENVDHIEEEEHDGLQGKTPHKLKIMSVQSSTPIHAASPSKSKSSSKVEQEKTEVSTAKAENNSTAGQYARSWSQSVSGTVADNSKIDVIESELSKQKKLKEQETRYNTSNQPKGQHHGKSRKLSSDDSDDDNDDMLEEDETDEDAEEEEEERDLERTIFVDDEAMEVPDGEESMSSGERQYLEENEIPVYGESLGSEDTEEDEDEEDNNESDDGFIVSDSENVHVNDAFESDEEVVKKPKEKKYKRIAKVSESSNEVENSAVDQESSYIKLLLESSDEKEDKLGKDEPLPANNSGRQSSGTPKGEDTEKEDNRNNRKSLNTSTKAKMENRPLSDTKMDDHNKTETPKLTYENIVKLHEPNKIKSNLQWKETPLSKDDVGVLNVSNSSFIEELHASKVSNEDKDSSFKQPRKSLNKRQNSSLGDDQSNKSKSDLDRTLSATECPTDRSNKSLDPSGDNKRLDGEQSSEQEDDEEEVETCFSNSDTEEQQKMLKEKSAVMEFLGEEETHTPSPLLKASRRQSMNQSTHDEIFELNSNGILSSNDDKMQQSSMKKSLDQSQLRRQSIHKKRPELESEEENNSEEEEEELQTARKVTTGRQSLNQNQLRRQSIHGKKDDAEPESDDEKEKTTAKPVSDRKSLNQSRRQSIHEKKTNTESDDQEEETTTAKPVPERKSFNQNRRQSIHEKKTNTDSDDQEEETTIKHVPERKSLNRSRRQSIHEMKTNTESDDQEEETTAKPVPERKSLNRSRRQSIHEKKTNTESDGQEEETTAKPVPERKSFNRIRRQSIHEKKTNTESDDQEEETTSKLVPERKSLNRSRRQSIHENKTNPESDTSIKSGDDKKEPADWLNQSRRKSIHEKETDPNTEDGSCSEEENEKQVLEEKSKASLNRQSLNRSQLRRQSIHANRAEPEIDGDNNSAGSSSEENQEPEARSGKKTAPDQLSVSLTNVEIQKKNDREAAIRKSFTIGVSVRGISTANSPAFNSTNTQGNQSEQEDTEDEQTAPSTKSKNIHSTSLKSYDVDGVKPLKQTKRLSLHNQSGRDDLVEEKTTSGLKRKRQSISFCGVVPTSIDETEVEPPHEPMSERKKKKDPIKGSDSKDIKTILSRCDEMLEAANRAKREAKLQAKKVKVKKPKCTDKDEKKPEADGVEIPLVSRKELKRKEKIKKELAKAIKHSTLLLKTIDPKLSKKLKRERSTNDIVPSIEDETSSSKRLPSEILEALEEAPPKKKRPKQVTTTPPSDKENSKTKHRNAHHTANIPEKKQKKKPTKEVIKTASGTVFVEPATPVKLRFQNGFRESPKTPTGFVVQDIHSASKDKSRKPTKSSFATSTTSKAQKRKRHIEEPKHTLSKVQWTSSGMFIEEDLHNVRSATNLSSTQFMVASLNGTKKTKSVAPVMSTETLNSALNFKHNALFNNKVKRESSREVMQRKQRKLANTHF